MLVSAQNGQKGGFPRSGRKGGIQEALPFGCPKPSIMSERSWADQPRAAPSRSQGGDPVGRDSGYPPYRGAGCAQRGVYTRVYASRYHGGYICLPTHHASLYTPGYTLSTLCTPLGTPGTPGRLDAGQGGPGLRAEKQPGWEVFLRFWRRKCLSSYALARRILCSRAQDRMKDWIDGGCFKAQGALERPCARNPAYS